MNKVRPLLVRSKLVTTLVPAIPPNEDGSGGSKETTITTSQTLTDEEFTKLEEKVDKWEENNANTGGEVSWKPVGTSWVNCRLWITFPPMYPPITFGARLECNLNI